MLCRGLVCHTHPCEKNHKAYPGFTISSLIMEKKSIHFNILQCLHLEKSSDSLVVQGRCKKEAIVFISGWHMVSAYEVVDSTLLLCMSTIHLLSCNHNPFFFLLLRTKMSGEVCLQLKPKPSMNNVPQAQIPIQIPLLILFTLC